MSDRYKQEAIKQAQAKVTELEQRRAEAVGRMEAAQQQARDAQGDIELLDSNLTQARQAVAEAEAA